MTILTRRSATKLLGASLATPFLSRSAFGTAEYAWKFGHGFPASHPLHVRASEAAAKIKQETNGRVDIGVYPNSQLGGDSDLLAQVRSGAVQFFSTGGLIFATLIPVAAISGTGFAFTDYPTVWSAMDGALGALVREGFERVNLHAFEKAWDNGFQGHSVLVM